VITNPRVPRVVRHSLNLESGLNDGLALPAVFVLAAALTPGPNGFVWWQFALESIALGLAVGVTVGLIATYLMPRKTGLAEAIPRHFRASIEDLVEIVKLAVFVVFASLLTVHGLFGSGWAAVALVAVALLVARPVAVFAALTTTETDTATRAVVAWFRPKAVGTMAFSLLVLSNRISAGVTIFNLAALTVFCSIVAHGLTDTAGANWMADRAEGESARERVWARP
jgi:NhaP-type Na+/H+ or K+/H+ antiporter